MAGVELQGCAHCAHLREILERLARIEERLTPRRCSPEDREVLAGLLVAMMGRIGSQPVTAREILEDKVLRRVAGNPSPGRLGGILSRAARDGVAVSGGLVIMACRERRGNARLWAVRKVVT